MTKKSFILGTSTLAIAASASLAAAEVNQPQEVVMRPLTTPGGQITVGGDLGIAMIADADTAIGLIVNGKYGVDDKIEVGLQYDISLSPEFEAKGLALFEGAYNIMDGDLSVAANASIGYDLAGEAISPLNLGARVRFRLSEQLAITSGSGGGIVGAVLPSLMPGGGQLTITLDGDVKPIFLSIPVGVGFQASPNLYAFVNTNVANIEIADASTGFIFADFLPLQVGAFFSPSNTMDFGASVGWFDVIDATDSIFIFGSARLHM